MRRIAGGIAALLVGASCAFQGTPVPVVGDTRLLEGEWEGSYSSEQSGRAGHIFFQLKAGRDSAFGDVLMTPAQAEDVRYPNQPERPGQTRPMSRLLSISFVRCADGEITGRLDPYVDPDSGERVFTTFEGHLTGNAFQGTFTSLYQRSGHVVRGKWQVERRNP